MFTPLMVLSLAGSSTVAHASQHDRDFATRLYQQLARAEKGKNLFLSPFSVQVALAMCSVGATGDTRRVLADLIGAPQNVNEQNRQYAKLLKSINGDGDRAFQLYTANALWGQRGYRFKSEFIHTVADLYGGTFQDVDFRDRPDQAVKTINGWVSQKTHDRIKNLIERAVITEDTRLILTNAIYFKGQWEMPFKRPNTKDEQWHGPESRKAPMMHRTGGYLYYEGDDFQALDIPYSREQVSMLVVLPREKDGLTSLEARWAEKDLYRLVTGKLHHERTVILSLPRFRMEAEFKLKPALRALGAGLAFSDSANFSGISEEPLRISEVVHKAFVEVNEEGTEAAAATGAVMAKAAASRPTRPLVFNADHPFLFVIREKETNTVLFSGRVFNP